MKLSILPTIAAAALLAAGCGDSASNVTLNGAGASFPDPVYQAWTYIYTQTGKATVNYQSIGSGAGINQIKEGTVDFAGTDAPLKSEEIKESKLTQFPMVTGAVTPIVNVAGITSGQLKLSDEVLAKIFMGEITKWHGAAIPALNPPASPCLTRRSRWSTAPTARAPRTSSPSTSPTATPTGRRRSARARA